jgi:hypothetical protein
MKDFFFRRRYGFFVYEREGSHFGLCVSVFIFQSTNLLLFAYTVLFLFSVFLLSLFPLPGLTFPFIFYELTSLRLSAFNSSKESFAGALTYRYNGLYQSFCPLWSSHHLKSIPVLDSSIRLWASWGLEVFNLCFSSSSALVTILNKCLLRNLNNWFIGQAK